MTLVTGQYDSLPAAADVPPVQSVVSRRTVTRFVGRLLITVLPLAILLGWNIVGPEIPGPLSQWLAGFAILWLITNILQVVDPRYGLAWDRVRDALSSAGPPDSSE